MAKLKVNMFVAVMLVAVALEVSARQRSDSARTQWSNGEENSLHLDMIRNAALGIGPSGIKVPSIEGSIIIVAHLGVDERSRLRNWRRLHNVRTYLVQHGIPPERIVAAEGVVSRGMATVEVFLGGKLRLTITVERNKDIEVDCCEGFPQYYPLHRGRPILQ